MSTKSQEDSATITVRKVIDIDGREAIVTTTDNMVVEFDVTSPRRIDDVHLVVEFDKSTGALEIRSTNHHQLHVIPSASNSIEIRPVW